MFVWNRYTKKPEEMGQRKRETTHLVLVGHGLGFRVTTFFSYDVMNKPNINSQLQKNKNKKNWKLEILECGILLLLKKKLWESEKRSRKEVEKKYSEKREKKEDDASENMNRSTHPALQIKKKGKRKAEKKRKQTHDLWDLIRKKKFGIKAPTTPNNNLLPPSAFFAWNDEEDVGRKASCIG